MWQHNYEPLAGSLGLSALLAAVPIIVLFVMLGVLRKPSWLSALTALASGMAPTEYGHPLDEVADRLSAPGYEPLETGWTRRPG